MPRPGLSLLLGLCVASVLPSSLRAHGCPTRSTARLHGPAQDRQQPHPSAGSASPWSGQLRCCSFLALSLLLAALCLGCSLRRKAKRRRREEKAWTRSAWPSSCCLAARSSLSDELIGRQEENSASIGSFLRHLRQRCLRGNAPQTGSNSNAGKDLDEEAALFSD